MPLNPSHHPSPSLVASYATGQLPMAAELALAAHLEACAPCAGQVREMEAAEGRLMESLPDALMGSNALAQAMAAIDRKEVGADPGAGCAEGFGTRLPAAMAGLGFHPRRWLRPGFWAARARTPDEEGWRLVLLRAPAGERLPSHRHTGDEFITVLSGSFRDGETFAAGDFAAHGVGDQHRLTVTREGPCACLVAYQSRAEWEGLPGLAAAWLGL